MPQKQEDLSKQRDRFEEWVVTQFPGQFRSEILAKDSGGAYEDLDVSFMFLGFCAGWLLGR